MDAPAATTNRQATAKPAPKPKTTNHDTPDPWTTHEDAIAFALKGLPVEAAVGEIIASGFGPRTKDQIRRRRQQDSSKRGTGPTLGELGQRHDAVDAALESTNQRAAALLEYKTQMAAAIRDVLSESGA